MSIDVGTAKQFSLTQAIALASSSHRGETITTLAMGKDGFGVSKTFLPATLGYDSWLSGLSSFLMAISSYSSLLKCSSQGRLTSEESWN